MKKEIKEKLIDLMFKNFGNCPKKLPNQILAIFEEEKKKWLKEKNCQCKNPSPNSHYEVGEHEGRYQRCKVCDRRIWD